MTSVSFKLDPDFQYVVKMAIKFHDQPNLDLNELELQDLLSKYRKLLNKYGNMGWCVEMGFATNEYIKLTKKQLEMDKN